MCNWLSVEVKRGAKVFHPATVVAVLKPVTHEEIFGSLLWRVFEQYHDDTVTCGFYDIYNDIHSIFINICLPTDPTFEPSVLVKQYSQLEWPQ